MSCMSCFLFTSGCYKVLTAAEPCFCGQVNGVQMTGKSQSDAVAVLRTIAANSVAALIVSRQVVDDAEVLALSDMVGILPLSFIFYQFFTFLHSHS